MEIPTDSQSDRISNLVGDLALLAHSKQAKAIQELADGEKEDPLVLSYVKLELGFCGTLNLAPDEEIDGYQIKETLGKGGMGVVYLAWDQENSRKVALKTVSPDLLTVFNSDKEVRDLLLKEVGILEELRREGIPLVYASGKFQHAGRTLPYFVMEAIDGLNVKVWASQDRTTAEILQMFSRLAESLHAAHQQRVMHLDLKPDNVLVDDDGQPIVLDFGLARIVEKSLPIRRTWLLPGTPKYMSPEQVTDSDEPLNEKSDQYSAALMLYECISGRHPYQFSGKTGPEIRLAVVGRKIRPLKWYYRPIDRVLKKALSKSPGDRYESMEEFGAALTKARRWYLPGRWVGGVLMLLFLLVASLTALGQVELRRADVEKADNKLIEEKLDRLAAADSVRREGNATQANEAYRELIKDFNRFASDYSAQTVRQSSSSTAVRNFGWCRYGLAAAEIGLNKTYSEHRESDVVDHANSLVGVIRDINEWAVQYAELNSEGANEDHDEDGLFMLLKAMAVCEKARLSHLQNQSVAEIECRNALSLIEQLRPVVWGPRIKHHFQETEAMARYVEGMVLMSVGRYDEALGPIRKAENLFVAAGDNVNKVTSATAHADVLAETGDARGSLDHYDYVIRECRFCDRDGVELRYWFRLALAKALANSSRIVVRQNGGSGNGLSRIEEAFEIVEGKFHHAPPSFREEKVLLASQEFQSIHTEVLLSANEFIKCSKEVLKAVEVLKHGKKSVQPRIAVCWMHRAVALFRHLQQHPDELEQYESQAEEAFEIAITQLRKWRTNPWYAARLAECELLRSQWEQLRTDFHAAKSGPA